MDRQINLFEKQGLEEYKNKKWLWQALFACNNLYEAIANNMDEIPEVKYQDLYMFITTLLQVKYSIIELIGRDKA